jgi:hypothetical protein
VFQTSGVADEDYVAGLDVVFKSLTAPMMQIAENAGIDGEVCGGCARASLSRACSLQRSP